MHLGRHLILLFASIFLLVLAGHWIPKAFDLSVQDWLPATPSILPSDTVEVDSISFEDGLKSALPVLKTIKSRTRTPKRPEVWVVGNGISMPNYMLRAQQYIHSQNGAVIRMEEIHGRLPAALLSCIDSSGNPLQVEVRIGDSYLDSASRIGVAFMIEELTPATLLALTRLEFPLTLLVPPFDTSKSLFAMIDQIPNKEWVAWIPMEGRTLLDRHLGAHSIQIHHSESDIESTIADAFRRLPEAAGVATRHGQRAVEHKPLLLATLKPIAKRKKWFWDLTGNRFSHTNAACAELGAQCKVSAPYQPHRTTLESYIQRGLYLARKSGVAAIVLPLNDESLDAMFRFKESASAQGTEIVKMSTIIGDGN